METNTQHDLSALLSRYESVFVLTDEQVANSCLPVFSNQPSMADAKTLVLPAGEEHKNIQTVQRIWDWLIAEQATRHSVLINLGGGVICDMGGFAAATYMRGMHFINIPTTLLAMVDAGQGGKTGIDYGTPVIKNGIGMFAEADATIYEPQLLQSLPAEQILSGYAEMLKHGLLQGEQTFYELLEQDLREVSLPAFGEKIRQSVAFKMAIVEQDPTDNGLRQILNLGHTVGHAIEALLLSKSKVESRMHPTAQACGDPGQSKAESQQPIAKPHGYCVMYGLVAEAYLSHMLCGLDASVVSRLSRFMLENYGAAPVTCKDHDALIELMQHDKKNKEQGTITCTLLRSIGQPVTGQSVTPQQIREALEYLCNL